MASEALKNAQAAQPRKVAVNPPECPPLFRPYYSESVRVTGTLLFIAGQVSFDKAGKVVHKGDMKGQTRQALENLKTVLRAHNATLDNLVKMTVYTTRMDLFEDIAQVREEYFPKNGPTSAIVGVKELALPDLMVEFETIAVVD